MGTTGYPETFSGKQYTKKNKSIKKRKKKLFLVFFFTRVVAEEKETNRTYIFHDNNMKN